MGMRKTLLFWSPRTTETHFLPFNIKKLAWNLDVYILIVYPFPPSQDGRTTQCNHRMSPKKSLGRAWSSIVLGRNDQKSLSRHKGSWLLLIEPLHCVSSSILLVTFFWDTLFIWWLMSRWSDFICNFPLLYLATAAAEVHNRQKISFCAQRIFWRVAWGGGLKMRISTEEKFLWRNKHLIWPININCGNVWYGV